MSELRRVSEDDILLAVTDLFLQAVEREERQIRQSDRPTRTDTQHRPCREEPLLTYIQNRYRKGKTI